MNDPFDRELLERFRAGQPAALKEIYLVYAPKLTAFLQAGFAFSSQGRTCSFLGFSQLHDLENARQEIFIRAFSTTARTNYDGLRPFVDYLFAIGRNHVISQFRRHKVALEPFDEVEEPADEAASAPERLENREVESLLAEFLSGLEEDDRRLHQIRFVDNKTQHEAAEAMGLTRIQLRRIEKRFRLNLLGFFRERGYLESREASRVKLKLLALLR